MSEPLPPEVDETEEPLSFQKDAMLHAYNMYRGFKTRTLKREAQFRDSFGTRTILGDNIKSLISNAYENDTITPPKPMF